jgi:hypothetical protein
MDIETRTRVAGTNRNAAYDELLAHVERGVPFDPDKLTDEFRARELDLAYSEVDLFGILSLRELSLKYYGDTKYWPLNAKAFGGKVTDETGPKGVPQPIHVVHFIGWPR